MPRRQIAPSTVAHALGGWATSQGPLYRRLAAGIGAAIDRGDLPAGACLPAERRLAATLSVARGTVVAAYELLRDGNVVERRHGSGTWITAAVDAETGDVATVVSAGRLTGRLPGGPPDVVDLGVSILPDAAELRADALAVNPAQLERLTGGHGYQPAGLRALRHRLAELHTATGLPTVADQIVVTTGAQQGIALIAQLLVRPGDTVIVDRPTYPGALEAYARAGARLLGVDVDGAGVRVDDLAAAAAAEQARLAYVVATCHNPVGSVMPEGRRRALAALADGGLVVVDDASLAHLVFVGTAPPPVAAFTSPDAPALTVGSLSKLLWGGLRVGWVRAPEPIAAQLGRLKASTDIGSSTLAQVVALRALADHDAIVERLRRRHAERARLLESLLAEQLPSWRFTSPDGGLSLWAELPSGTADGFAPVAAQHGVLFLPGSAASVDDAHPRHLRLSFALPPDRLETGVRRLAVAWADQTAADDRTGVAAAG